MKTAGYTLDQIEALEEGWFFYDHAWSLLFEVIKRVRGDSLLDVGCGTGIAASIIASVYPKLKVVGMEPNDNAREIWKARGVEVKVGSATDIPFEADSFDTVFSSHVVEHIEDDKKAVSEILRVARRRAIIVVPEGNVDAKNFGSPHVKYYDRRNFKQLIVEATPEGYETDVFLIPHPHINNLTAVVDRVPR